VALFGAATLLTRSWEGDLHGDPVRYAAVARNILATGDWLTLHDGPGCVYANKPPLMFWLVAMNFRLFGVSTYTAKLWSCLFGIGACLMTYLVGRRLFGGTAGMLAGCMLAMTVGFVPNAVDLRLDSAVTFFAVLAVYGILRADQDDRPRWLLLVGLAAGLGAMTKPSAALHVAALTLLLLGVRRPSMLVTPFMLGALALAAAIAAPWHVLLVTRQGEGFVDVYFREQIGSRMAMGVHFFSHVWANMSVLLLRSLPWWPLGVYAVARRRRSGSRERWGTCLALLWIAEVVILMAVPPKRYDRYTMPAYPAIALLAGFGLNLLLSVRVRKAVAYAAMTTALLIVFVLATVPVQVHTYSCAGFGTARELLDRVSPGQEVASYDPHMPPGPGHDPRQWGLRSKIFYYMGRRLENYPDLEQLLASPEAFVIVRDRHQDALTGTGFKVLLRLDNHYRLAQRCAPGAAADAEGAGRPQP